MYLKTLTQNINWMIGLLIDNYNEISTMTLNTFTGHDIGASEAETNFSYMPTVSYHIEI